MLPKLLQQVEQKIEQKGEASTENMDIRISNKNIGLLEKQSEQELSGFSEQKQTTRIDRSGNGVSVTYLRQLQIFDPEDYLNRKVSIIGLGTIGSWTALALAKLGIKNLSIYDFDLVDKHNIPNQFYKVTDIGTPEAFSLMNSIKEFSDIDSSSNNKYEAQLIEDILIIGVDSMQERKRIHSELEKKEQKPIIIIDGRIGGSQLEIYTCQSLEEWGKTFIDQPSNDPCGARAIVGIGMVMGGFISNQVVKYLTNKHFPKNIIFDLNGYKILT